jgi:hypothetical protein
MTDQRILDDKYPLGLVLARMLIVTLIALVMSGLVALLLRGDRLIPAPLLAWSGIAGMGLVVGGSVRGLMGAQSHVFRSLTAILALAAGLWMMGWLSQGQLGFTQSGEIETSINWFALEQLALSTCSAWLVLWAERVRVKPAEITIHPLENKPRLKPSTQSSKSASRREHAIKKRRSRKVGKRIGSPKNVSRQSSTLIGANSWNRIVEAWQGWRTLAGRSLREGGRSVRTGVLVIKQKGIAVRHRLRTWSRTQARKGAARLPKMPLKVPSTQGAHQADHVRLVGRIEHRCPYCLELVEQKDPRGVKVCPVCNTHHHLDCWLVTGTCQVPHHYE